MVAAEEELRPLGGAHYWRVRAVCGGIGLYVVYVELEVTYGIDGDIRLKCMGGFTDDWGRGVVKVDCKNTRPGSQAQYLLAQGEYYQERATWRGEWKTEKMQYINFA
jgi:hypothetical protein